MAYGRYKPSRTNASRINTKDETTLGHNHLGQTPLGHNPSRLYDITPWDQCQYDKKPRRKTLHG